MISDVFCNDSENSFISILVCKNPMYYYNVRLCWYGVLVYVCVLTKCVCVYVCVLTACISVCVG
jgi:hypothetical protein